MLEKVKTNIYAEADMHRTGVNNGKAEKAPGQFMININFQEPLVKSPVKKESFNIEVNHGESDKDISKLASTLSVDENLHNLHAKSQKSEEIQKESCNANSKQPSAQRFDLSANKVTIVPRKKEEAEERVIKGIINLQEKKDAFNIEVLHGKSDKDKAKTVSPLSIDGMRHNLHGKRQTIQTENCSVNSEPPSIQKYDLSANKVTVVQGKVGNKKAVNAMINLQEPSVQKESFIIGLVHGENDTDVAKIVSPPSKDDMRHKLRGQRQEIQTQNSAANAELASTQVYDLSASKVTVVQAKKEVGDEKVVKAMISFQDPIVEKEPFNTKLVDEESDGDISKMVSPLSMHGKRHNLQGKRQTYENADPTLNMEPPSIQGSDIPLNKVINVEGKKKKSQKTFKAVSLLYTGNKFDNISEKKSEPKMQYKWLTSTEESGVGFNIQTVKGDEEVVKKLSLMHKDKLYIHISQ